MGLIYAMRGLSALSVSTIWAMREPRHVGWAKANPTLYFCRGNNLIWQSFDTGDSIGTNMDRIRFVSYNVQSSMGH